MKPGIENQILESKGIDMPLQLLTTQEITSTDLLKIYFKRCIDIGLPLNAIADFVIEDSFEFANILDQERNKGKLRSAQHGLPISIKANIPIKGYDIHCGLVSKYDKLCEKDAYIVEILKKLGCIPFIRSNLPQGACSIESFNFIVGGVQNPLRPDRVPGGSSGGEAVLVKTGCSPIGLGTDLAGSIRLPSLFCGLKAFVFGPERITNNSCMMLTPVDKQTKTITTTNFGLLAHSTSDIEIITKELCNMDYMYKNQIDLIKKDWDESTIYSKKKLRVCYIDTSIDYEVSLPIKNAMKKSVELLKSKGHIVDRIDVDLWKNPTWDDLMYNNKYVMCQMARNQAPSFGNEILANEARQIYSSVCKVNQFVLRITGFLCQYVIGWHLLAKNLKLVYNKLNGTEYIARLEKLRIFRGKIRQIMQDGNYNGQMLPGGMVPAHPVGMSKEICPLQAIYILPNLMRMCFGSICVKVVEKFEEVYTTGTRDQISMNIEKCMKGSEGLPVGVQVCALKFQEENVVKIMKELEDLSQFKY